MRIMLRVTLQTVFLGTMVIGWLLTAAAPAQIVGESAELEHVLAQMDAAARDFKTAEATSLTALRTTFEGGLPNSMDVGWIPINIGSHSNDCEK